MNKRNYREIYLILNKLGDEYIKKIPPKLYKYIEENMDTELVQNQRISKDSISFIAGLHYKYWLQSDDEKAEFLNILNENSAKKNEKYNVENLFEKNTNNKENMNKLDSKIEEKMENETKRKLEIRKENVLGSKIQNKIDNNITNNKNDENNQKQQCMGLIKPEKWYNRVINFFKNFFRTREKNK